MKASQWLRILLLTTACAATSGCSPLAFLFPPRPVYVPPGAMVELAEPVTAEGWITNKQTGERERRAVEGQAGWLLVRPRIEGYGKPPELEAHDGP
jgi:hypothetical protein